MQIKLKLWSLGSTAFGDFVPKGNFAGGERDRITLSSLGSVGYVSPIGTILSATTQSVSLEDVDLQDAETREAPIVGLAWDVGYQVEIVDVATNLATLATIATVSLDTITFEEDLGFTPSATVFNSAGFPVSGHFLRHAEYYSTTQVQKQTYAHFGPPNIGYPTSGAREIEEQRSGAHNFEDGRVPYVLYPAAFTPSV